MPARINLNCPCFSSWLPRPSFVPTNGISIRVMVAFVAVLSLVCIFLVYSIESTSFHERRRQAHLKFQQYKQPDEPTDVKNQNLHYGVVVDCGSSGSRVYVYYWPPHSGKSGDLLQIQQMISKDLNPISKKIMPGLSTYADKPSSASDYIKPLLDFAASHIPTEKHKETPLYILATAGMRMLTPNEQKDILYDLRLDIPLISRFLFAESHVEIITGKQEGLYAWIAINYVLGRFDHSYQNKVPLEPINSESAASGTSVHYRKQTVGIIDMGGGSVQIAFEVRESVRNNNRDKLNLSKHLLAEVNLGCQEEDIEHIYKVYVTTFLAYGANVGRSRYEEQLIQNSIRNTNSNINVGKNEKLAISDPCLSLNMVDTVEINGTSYYLRGTGDYSFCQNKIRPLLNLTVPCHLDACSMNGVYQPGPDFSKDEFYGFSEYWYCSEDVLRMGGKYDFNKFKTAAATYCSTAWSTAQDWYKKKLYPKADWNRFKNQCFKSAWTTMVLHEGFKFPENYKSFTSAQLVNGKDVQWTLGALIYKTKYYPLSDLQKHITTNDKPPWIKSVLFNAEYLFILCILIVIFAIILYWRRLHRLQKESRLHRVPTMSYFMTEQDQIEQGITIENAYLDS